MIQINKTDMNIDDLQIWQTNNCNRTSSFMNIT